MGITNCKSCLANKQKDLDFINDEVDDRENKKQNQISKRGESKKKFLK